MANRSYLGSYVLLAERGNVQDDVHAGAFAMAHHEQIAWRQICGDRMLLDRSTTVGVADGTSATRSGIVGSAENERISDFGLFTTRIRHTAFGCIPETAETVLLPVLRVPSCNAVKIVTNLSWLHHWGEVC